MKPVLVFFLLCLFQFSMAQKPAYIIYDKNEKKSSYEELLKKAKKSDVILFGEYHNNPIHHWLQLELVNDLFENDVA